MIINGGTRVYGVIGDPVDHTLSPLLHNAVFERRGVNAVYVPFLVPNDELAGVFESLRSMNIGGLNITIPHKEQAIHYVDSIPNSMDKAVGAINTLVRFENRTMGFNTDVMGFIDDIKHELAFAAKGKAALVIGAGGAARAVAFGLLQEGVEKLYVYNRTLQRAHGLADYLKLYFEDDARITAIESIDEVEDHVDLLVNCTSCGMKAKDPLPINPEVLDHTSAVYDVIYAPERTLLLQEADRRNIRNANGIGMLIRQAAISHRLWFPTADKNEIVNIMRETYLDLKKKAGK